MKRLTPTEKKIADDAEIEGMNRAFDLVLALLDLKYTPASIIFGADQKYKMVRKKILDLKKSTIA